MNPDHTAYDSSVFALVGLAITLGFYAAFAARKIKLPSIIGYMVVGVLLGPSLIGLFGEPELDQLSFIMDVALGFVAFSIGSELNMSSLKRQGIGLVTIILCESFGAFIVVTVAIYAFTRDWPMALVFGSMAPASAPAGTVAVIQEYKARGSLTKTLLAVVGFDDGLAIIIFAFAVALAKSLIIGKTGGAESEFMTALLEPLKNVVLSLALGGAIGFIFCQMARRTERPADLLIFMSACVFAGIGLSLSFGMSLILTNMAIGFVLANMRTETNVRRIMSPLMQVMPLMFILFFFLAGAHLKLHTLPALGVLGTVYIAGRTTGLIGGAWIGSMIGHVEDKIRKYVGLGILSQAGVAIGLSLIVKREFDQIATDYGIPHAAEIGAATLTTITATCLFFEIIGPILTKVALQKAGEIKD